MGEAVIILAGGLGTRLREVLPDTPKCLAPVGDRTFLEILVQSLARRGFDEIVLALGHKAGQVRDAAGRFDLSGRIRCVTEAEPLGTGGAILHAMSEAGLAQAAVVNGDTYYDGDMAGWQAPLGENELCRMAIAAVDDRARYGGIDIGFGDAAAGPVRGFIEKGSSGPGWINAGYYKLHKDCFSGFRAGRKFSFETDVLPALAGKGQLSYVKLQGNMIDIGIPADYRRFCDMWG